MPTRYKIHPSIGVARLGNSQEFYLGPESLGALPANCDANGNVIESQGGGTAVETFRDSAGAIKRQGQKFTVYMYDDAHPDGIELVVKDAANKITGTTVTGLEGQGELIGITWWVWMANKKSAWYEFKELKGEHGYPKNAKLRNAGVSDRSALVIDPGPVAISGFNQSAEMAQGQNPNYTQSFPPPLAPNAITSLGSVRTDNQGRLVVVGAYGNSGSMLTGLGQPQITHFANNDGWFDDIADGPVTAVLTYSVTADNGAPKPIAITDPAWCVVGYPRFAPEIPDMVTMDDLLYDLFVREFAYAPYLYGVAPYAPVNFDYNNLGIDEAAAPKLESWRKLTKTYNEDYWPYWDTDLFPILSRPYLYQTFCTQMIQDDPHETGANGNFDWTKISVPPPKPNDPKNDPNWSQRNFIYSVLRQPSQENVYDVTVPMPPPMQPIKQPLMPMLNGDNPLTNDVVSKFFLLTRTQLFFLKQWAAGKFIAGNEPTNDPSKIVGPPPPPQGVQIDRGVLANALGGAFCPGAETTWIIRDPAIFIRPYCIRQSKWKVNIGDTFQAIPWYEDPQLNSGTTPKKGLQAGDLTKRNAVPWQADFNQCTTNDTDVRYEAWNKISNEPPLVARPIIWWPAHHPLQVNIGAQYPDYNYVQWTFGIGESDAGNLKMVTAWAQLGFLRNTSPQPVTAPWFVLQEAQNQPG